jgi:hypothetical protein
VDSIEGKNRGVLGRGPWERGEARNWQSFGRPGLTRAGEPCRGPCCACATTALVVVRPGFPVAGGAVLDAGRAGPPAAAAVVRAAVEELEAGGVGTAAAWR